MIRKFYITAFSLCVFLFACNSPRIVEELDMQESTNNPPANIDTGAVDTTVTTPPEDTICLPMPDSFAVHCLGGDRGQMVIVRFATADQKDKVIVQDPIDRYDGIWGQFLYKIDKRLSLNMSYYSSKPMAEFMEEVTHITGQSPYIYLTDDFYLIDWKWQCFHPLSSIASYSSNNAYHKPMEEQIRYHSFTTDINWTDLTNLTQTWSNAQFRSHVQVNDVWSVGLQHIDAMYDEMKTDYICYGEGLYVDGLSASIAYQYYLNDSTYFCHYPGEYLSYISYCDSLQDVYVEHLIDMIHQGIIK